MDLLLTQQQQVFRQAVREFLASSLTSGMRSASRSTPTIFASPDLGRRWQRILYEKGWLAHTWPVEYGGTGWSPIQRYLFEKECALADAPALPGMGLRMLGPVLYTFGTPWQCEYYLPRILSGEHYWCQGFSEPSAGSDLASVTTRAERRGDQYVVNGCKTWTTFAHHSDHMFCLVRTNDGVEARRGLTFLLIDMRQPGVRVEPIIGLAGDHEINTVFLDDVEVSFRDRVGEENHGWAIAKFLLEHERGGTCFSPRMLADLTRLGEHAATIPVSSDGYLLQDATYRNRLARLELEAAALETTELRILADIAAGGEPGPKASLVKLIASNLRQAIDSLAVLTFGYDALELTTSRSIDADSRPARIAAAAYLNSRAWTIFGGTNEIQRTIIAKSILSL